MATKPPRSDEYAQVVVCQSDPDVQAIVNRILDVLLEAEHLEAEHSAFSAFSAFSAVIALFTVLERLSGFILLRSDLGTEREQNRQALQNAATMYQQVITDYLKAVH